MKLTTLPTILVMFFRQCYEDYVEESSSEDYAVFTN